MAEDKSDEWFAKHNKQKAAAWEEEAGVENCMFVKRSDAEEEICRINLFVMSTSVQADRKSFLKGPSIKHYNGPLFLIDEYSFLKCFDKKANECVESSINLMYSIWFVKIYCWKSFIVGFKFCAAQVMK